MDQKGRLKIPSVFLEELAKYGEEFYVTSDSGDHAQVYPMQLWKEIEEKLARAPTHHEAKQKFLTRTNYFGQVVKMDRQGRILIPPVLREEAEIKGEVEVMGDLKRIEVWNRARFREHLKVTALTGDDKKALSDLGI